MKVIFGPGTGLGVGFLTKPKPSSHYEVHSSEGGHAEFSPRNDLEFGLVKFAK